MTGTLPAVAARACGRPRHGLTAAARPYGWSPDGNPVSQDRDGWLQIQSSITEGQEQRAMIGAMHERPEHRLTEWSSNTTDYTSAYQSFCTVVYTKAKEVS
jgi:hypothetical protein